jgi:hypothetical protein
MLRARGRDPLIDGSRYTIVCRRDVHEDRAAGESVP